MRSWHEAGWRMKSVTAVERPSDSIYCLQLRGYNKIGTELIVLFAFKRQSESSWLTGPISSSKFLQHAFSPFGTGTNIAFSDGVHSQGRPSSNVRFLLAGSQMHRAAAAYASVFFDGPSPPLAGALPWPNEKRRRKKSQREKKKSNLPALSPLLSPRPPPPLSTRFGPIYTTLLSKQSQSKQAHGSKSRA